MGSSMAHDHGKKFWTLLTGGVRSETGDTIRRDKHDFTMVSDFDVSTRSGLRTGAHQVTDFVLPSVSDRCRIETSVR